MKTHLSLLVDAHLHQQLVHFGRAALFAFLIATCLCDIASCVASLACRLSSRNWNPIWRLHRLSPLTRKATLPGHDIRQYRRCLVFLNHIIPLVQPRRDLCPELVRRCRGYSQGPEKAIGGVMYRVQLACSQPSSVPEASAIASVMLMGGTHSPLVQARLAALSATSACRSLPITSLFASSAVGA